MVEEDRGTVYVTRERLLINLLFRENRVGGDFNNQDLLVKLGLLLSAVQITLFLSGIRFPIVQSLPFLEKSILVPYHYYCIRTFV